MKPSSVLSAFALLALSAPGWCMAASSAAPAASQAQPPVPTAQSAASAACPRRPAPWSGSGHATSKARHVVDDGDPCADPHSPPPRGPAASRP